MLAVAVIAGVMVTVGVAPAVALTGVTASRGVGLFESLPSDLKLAQLDQKTELYAKSGTKNVLIGSFYTQNREVVGEDGISQIVKNAAVAGEDARFYQHGGVDPMGIARAALRDLAGKPLQGASTITQQYVKNVCIQEAERLPTQKAITKAYYQCVDPTAGRKVREIRYAIGLEKRYSKAQILLGYLNIAGFGGRVYGIQAAANYYFNKEAKDLTITQAAALVAIVNNPTKLRLDDPKNLAANTSRRNYVITAEYQQHMITAAQRDEALASTTKVTLTPPKTGCSAAGAAGFFCSYVQQILLSNKAFGKTDADRQQNVETAGWKVYSTLNLDLEKKAKKVLNTYVPAKSNGFPNLGGSSVSVEVGTGRIVSMVENKKYDPVSSEHGTAASLNYGVDSKYSGGGGFQPGSTFKLFTLLQWLKTGHGLNAAIPVAARTYDKSQFSTCGEPYGTGPYPVANDELGEKGSRTVLAATAASINNAFMSMALKLDLCDIRDMAAAFDVHPAGGGKLTPRPSMVIGASDLISPLTMTTAYAGMGNQGKTCTAIAIDRVIDRAGNSIAVPKTSCKQSVDKQVAIAAAYALRGVITSGTAAGDQTSDGIYEFGKTGTTDNAKQTWFVATTNKVATGVWIGNIKGDVDMYHNFSLPYCPVKGSNQASLERHCVWRGIQTEVNKIYGGATSWPQPEPQYLGGGGSFAPTPNDPSNDGTVPTVTGQSEGSAIAAITGQGMSYVIAGAVKSGKPRGTIVRQSPSGGSKANGHVTVTIYPSRG